MKFSIYTSAIDFDERHTLLFNAFTYTFVVIKNRFLDITGMTTDDVKMYSADLYDQLINAGMVVEDSIDEPSLLRKRIFEADNNKSEYILHINPTMDCNFNCWYCYENHVPNSKMSEDVVKATKRFIKKILQDQYIKTFELGFFGGEPLLYFNSIAKDIIIHTNDICQRNGKSLHIHFTSNGSLLNDELIGFLAKFSSGFQITLDGGRHTHNATRFYRNGKGSYDMIVRNILKLTESHIDVIVRVNYTAENIDSVPGILDSFNMIKENQRPYIKFDFQRVWQDCDKNDETERRMQLIRNRFRERGFTVLTNYLHHDVRYSCYGDKLNHVLINYNGDLFGCTARDFVKENRIGFIDQDGFLNFDEGKIQRRNTSKLSKRICGKCRIAPICGGGCKQRASEACENENCTMEYSEADMDNKILDIFESEFMKENWKGETHISYSQPLY